MKVKFIYRNYKKLHTIHSSIVKNPPSGVEFVVPEEKKFLKKLYPVYRRLKGSRLFSKLIENVKDKFFVDRGTKEGVALLYFINFVPKEIIINVPYVIDFEHVISLTDFMENPEFFEKNVVPFLKDEECKKVIPLSNAAKKTLEKKLRSDYSAIKNKVRVVYPSLPLYKGEDFKREEDQKMSFLFVGNHVYRKGLHELLEAFSRVPTEDAILKIVSVVPPELKENYQQKNIEFFLPQYTHEEILRDFFSKADAFVMPTHRDTFGMVFLDAMSCGTPVIATNQFAIPELVEDGETGFLVETKKQYLWDDNPVFDLKMEKEMMVPEEELIDRLYEKINYCIKNPEELREMRKNTKKLFVGPNGKFSIERRNRLLKQIYEEALEIS
jgi:glycosyltransferase involved in cell wall biosynthesis